MIESIRLEVLRYSYAEHFKAAKEISLILPPEHPRRKQLYEIADTILKKINLIKQHDHKTTIHRNN